jgi:hypothetical protein
MKEEIKKKIEEEALRRFPKRNLSMGNFGDDMNDDGRINFEEGAEYGYNLAQQRVNNYSHLVNDGVNEFIKNKVSTPILSAIK